ncbi:hypothetical protein H5410_014364 [Solanum commersonii]|uniref:Glycosyl hydrolase family 63 C-terminal domain-containing protein n=1 Tax=Solanum commersonii TaxID=4109 RepID=A0A9J5ZR69_SOLCO|nr:hypothetical protein H5410_014364 [Solanum commersonii]
MIRLGKLSILYVFFPFLILNKTLPIVPGTSLTSLFSEKQKEFDNKFKKSFILSDELGLEPVTVGKAALGNMLGGIGYFFGQSKISLPSTSTLNSGDNSVLYWPAELYTAVPSWPFFPRASYGMKALGYIH